MTTFQQTYIARFNPFLKDSSTLVIGVGGTRKGFPDWYLALETYAHTTLFDNNDQPILKNISNYYAEIGCYIPECLTYGTLQTRYWHQHLDPDFSMQSVQNANQQENKTFVSFGGVYRVLFIMSNEKQRRVLVPRLIYHSFFSEPWNVESGTWPESVLYLCQTPGGLAI